MTDQPNRNESRFYRYPFRRVVAVFDDSAAVEAATSRLRDVGINIARVAVLSGPEGARLLDRSGKKHGLRGRVLRLVQQGAYEGDLLDRHERALDRGSHVMYVPVRGNQQQSHVAEILRAAGGHDVVYFARWSITDL